MPNLPDRPRSGAVTAFLDQLARLPAVRPVVGQPARLIFAIDATASRQPSWDAACHLQAEMFHAAASLGGIAVQLAYYRGYLEFAATPFLTDPADLTRRMGGLQCLGGQTQIARVLTHAVTEARAARLPALIFVGDAVEEAADPLCHLAGQLGLAGTPGFFFQEGHAPAAAAVFAQLARLSGGAHVPFDPGAGDVLRGLLRAVAVFATGGRGALAALPSPAAQRLTRLLPRPAR